MALEFDEAIEDFISARDKLNALIAEKFPCGTVVRLKREGSFGIIVSGCENHPGTVPVYMESDNIWDKPATSLDVVPNKSKWPSGVKSRLSKMKIGN